MLLVFIFVNLLLPLRSMELSVIFPQILSPQSGDVLQGMVNITGSTNVEDLDYSTISFAYEGSESGTWFEIHESREGVQNGTLAIWDTTTISDGTYSLRLEVFLKNGEHKEDIVSGLKIRNYTPIETNTPRVSVEGVQSTEEILATEELTPIQRMPSALPINPAQVTPGSIRSSLLVGSSVAFVSMGLLAAYGWFKSRSRK
jgi:hypothetical protein